MNKLRQTLGDVADQPHYVETLPGVGYRFVAPVHPAGGAVLESTDKAIGLSEAALIDTPVQSARDLSREPKEISGGVGLTKTSEPTPRHRETFAWGVAALCIVLLAWFGVANWRGIQSAESRHLRLSLLPPPSTSFVPYNFAISPDGRRLAFVAAAQDGSSALWIRSLAAGSRAAIDRYGRRHVSILVTG